MDYLSAYYTDKGKRKGVNQDSLLIRQAEYNGQSALLAAVCDGMGGLQKGEMASTEVVRSFEEWFREKFEILTGQEEFEDVLYDSWEQLLQDVHSGLWEYSRMHGIRVGTTLTAMLLWQEKYYIAHVGDTRIYEIRDQVKQLTGDQVVAQLDDGGKKENLRNYEHRKMESETGKNILLQGVGCSPTLRPAYYSGHVEKDTVYVLCSDGFRHKLSNEELQKAFFPEGLINENIMEEQGRCMAQLVMERGEGDNITVLLIRTVGCGHSRQELK